ncbi:MAG: Pr6Pr family membrane protein [Ferruginibacter sp.]
MKKNLSILFAIIAWFALLTQYYLMIENRVASVGETTIRFISFFTILTNSIVAVYFTIVSLKNASDSSGKINKPGVLTAVTVYITIVGLVYQLLLRQIWHPTGLQKLVDELLHSVMPVFVILYWYLFEEKSLVSYRQVPKWLIYPLIYLVYILIRGSMAGFYPYPFVDVTILGLKKVLINSVLLTGVFYLISLLFIFVGKLTARDKKQVINQG